MTKKRRFGVSQAISRGLSETIHVAESSAGTFRNTVLPLTRIELDPDNPRKLAITLHDVRHGIAKEDPLAPRKLQELDSLKALAQTIESSGVINPVVAYKGSECYRIVAGERRCLASILAGKGEIEARVFNEKPKGFDLKLIQWIENTAREDLTLEERIGNIRDILNEYRQQHSVNALTPTLLHNITGLSLAQSSYYLTVMAAPEDVQLAIESGELGSLDKAAVIAAVDSDSLREELLGACREGCSLKELRQLAQKQKKLQQLPEKTLSAKRPGRAPTRVNLGATPHPEVAEFIVKSVLSTPVLTDRAEGFAKVDWRHYDQAASAFRKMVQLLEIELAE